MPEATRIKTTAWATCPICGGTDMRKETDEEGGSYIHCTNTNCLSNGGTDDSALARPPAAQRDAHCEPATFRDLVTWASWTVITGITSGQTIERTMTLVLDYARRWKPADEKAGS